MKKSSPILSYLENVQILNFEIFSGKLKIFPANYSYPENVEFEIFSAKLIEERDMWSGASHMLSLKVTDKHNLVTVRRLHLYEKAWYKLAHNFSALLTHEDSNQVT